MALGPDDFLLTNRVAVVTGAAVGIGRAIAVAFARFGADLALCDRDAENLATAAVEVEDAGRSALQFAIYAAQKAAVAQLSRSLALELGTNSIRVNCIAPDLIPTPGVGPLEGDSVTTAPIGVAGHVDDVAAAAVYLAGVGSRFV